MSSLPLLYIQTYSFLPCPNNFSFGCGNVSTSYPFSLYDGNTAEHRGLPGLLISYAKAKKSLTLPLVLTIGVASFFALLAIAFCIRLHAGKDKRMELETEERKTKKVVKVTRENFGLTTDNLLDEIQDRNTPPLLLLAILLSTVGPLLTSGASESGNSTCPLDLSYVSTIPWDQSECENTTFNRTNCCQTLQSVFSISFAVRLRKTGMFRLPDIATSASCLSVYQSKLSSPPLSFSSNVTSSCFTPGQFVISSNFCAGIQTEQDWVNKLGYTTVLNNACDSNLTDMGKCSSCLNAGIEVSSNLTAMDGNTSHATPCFYLTAIYAAGMVYLQGPLDPQTAYCIFGLALSNGTSNSSSGSNHTAFIASFVSASVLFVMLVLVIGLLFLRKSKRRKKMLLEQEIEGGSEGKNSYPRSNTNLENFGSLSPKRYTFSEIRKITKSFNQKIGQGGYASVFKGELMDGTPVAVKVLKDHKSRGAEFTSEVVLIAKTSHVNVVRLLGFSTEGSKRALIYEFMPNGSLDKYLHDCQNSTLSHVVCRRLFEIAVGIARGLEYLHRGCNTRIVHFDIKPHNILLDQDYRPKISDFGLAKFCQTKESRISMSGTRGTIGYIAPEVFSRNFGAVSSKSDVYSYGMMILEIFGGKQGKMELTNSSSDTYFPNYVYKCIEQNNICSVYGVSDAFEEIVRKITIIGLWCIQMVPQARPTMSAVLDMFDKNIEELALPPVLNVFPHPEVLAHETADLTVSSVLNDQQ